MQPTVRDRRRGNVLSAMIVALILMSITLVSSGSLAAAAGPPDAVLELPAGTACDFDLRIEIRGGNQVVKEFRDKNGEVVRTLSAGKGSALAFTNLSTGARFALKANGAVTHTRFNPDGSSTVGHHGA